MGITREELYRDILLELLRRDAERYKTLGHLGQAAEALTNRMFPKEGVKYGDG